MSYYLKEGELFWPTEAGAYDIRDKLPTGTYVVGYSDLRGWYLKPITEFEITGKIYGKTTNQADRILNTFNSRSASTGVLLSGEKGSGKTLLAKMVSTKAADVGVTTLVVNTQFSGDAFNTFIQSINEPCIIVFDEFEKVYDDEHQEAILTLLDGVYATKKLFILTANDKYRVNSHMRNRPGRIFYMLEFKGIDAEFIKEYCNDNLNNKSYIPQLCRLVLMFDSFNFDMLKAVVEEMNRYNESPKEAMEMLNAKPHDGGNLIHNVECVIAGKKIADNQFWPVKIRGNPLAEEALSFTYDPDPASDADTIEFEVYQKDLKKLDVETGTFTYVINEGNENMAVFVITRNVVNKSPMYSWVDAI